MKTAFGLFTGAALALALFACGNEGPDDPLCGDGVVQASEICDDGSANGTAGHCKVDCAGMPLKVSITGDVFAFMKEVPGPRVSGAKISVLEQPDKSVTTGSDGHFEIDGLDEGTEVTLVLEHPDYYPTQTATYRLGPHGIHPFAIQALTKSLFKAMSSLFTNLEQDTHCAIATTVTRLGGTLHVMVRQGEPGATLALSPMPADAKGPIYFSEVVIPDKTLKATTKDGGGLFYHVVPGDYAMSASKADVTFTPVKLKCRAGWLVNAGPPIGVQAQVARPDWGSSAAPDAYTASTDAFCEKTGECVNAQNGDGAYPPATVASCQETFRRALGFVDASCDAKAHVRDAWKAFFDCRAASCDLTLGGDDACAAEEKAYVDAMAAYAPCYTGTHVN